MELDGPYALYPLADPQSVSALADKDNGTLPDQQWRTPPALIPAMPTMGLTNGTNLPVHVGQVTELPKCYRPKLAAMRKTQADAAADEEELTERRVKGFNHALRAAQVGEWEATFPARSASQTAEFQPHAHIRERRQVKCGSVAWVGDTFRSTRRLLPTF